MRAGEGNKTGVKIGAALSVALHAAAFGALLSHPVARTAVRPTAAAPIMVDWIAPPQAERAPEPQPVLRPRPRPVVQRALPRPVESAPRVTAANDAPVAAAEPAPPSLPVPEPLVAAPAPATVPASLAITPPIFDAGYLRNPAPAYPPLSRRMGEQGKVVLRVLVAPSGNADEIQVRSSSGSTRLDDTARDTVRRWKFIPARRGDEPVPAWVLIPISFNLEG